MGGTGDLERPPGGKAAGGHEGGLSQTDHAADAGYDDERQEHYGERQARGQDARQDVRPVAGPLYGAQRVQDEEGNEDGPRQLPSP